MVCYIYVMLFFEESPQQAYIPSREQTFLDRIESKYKGFRLFVAYDGRIFRVRMKHHFLQMVHTRDDGSKKWFIIHLYPEDVMPMIYWDSKFEQHDEHRYFLQEKAKEYKLFLPPIFTYSDTAIII